MKTARISSRMCGPGGKASRALVWAAALLLLVSAGIAYRIPAHRLRMLGEELVMLPVSLSDFPTRLGNWVGDELPIPTTTREYMERNFADDFLSRRYVNSTDQIWVDMYVVYCSSRPGGILGHRPSVCYPAHGWLHESTEKSQFTSQYGRKIECLMQRFRKPAPSLDEVIVLSFYLRNGRIAADASDFSGVFGRKPNIARNPSRYIAQIQISSVLESSVRKAAQDMTDPVLAFLPDENGKVKAAAPISSSSSKAESSE